MKMGFEGAETRAWSHQKWVIHFVSAIFVAEFRRFSAIGLSEARHDGRTLPMRNLW